MWKAESLPKIKFFLWILLRGKALTSENLRKRGFIGPSRCPNCQLEEETSQHLFIDCPFASACWMEAFRSNNLPWAPGTSISEVLNIWKQNYPWGKKTTNIARRVWNALPCTLLWNIWLARNLMIFKGEETSVKKLYNKAWSLNLEALSTKCQGNLSILDLHVEERNYIGHLLDKRNTTQIRSSPISRANSRYSWKLRMKKKEFTGWLKNNNTHYLFFDDASKSNPGSAGAGGIICNGNGDVLTEFEWGLGSVSNNRAEALALFQGLLQLQRLGINTATIIGDSAIVISLMVSNRKALNLTLQQIIGRCQSLDQQMKDNRFYHVFRSLNKTSDALANRACSHPVGNLRCNGSNQHFFLPLSGPSYSAVTFHSRSTLLVFEIFGLALQSLTTQPQMQLMQLQNLTFFWVTSSNIIQRCTLVLITSHAYESCFSVRPDKIYLL